MRKETVINKEELLDVINQAVQGEYDFYEYEGVVQDNYVIFDAHDLTIAGEKVGTEYLVIHAKPVTSWTCELIAIRIHDEHEVQKYIDSWTGVIFND
ncbi:hypothetical protein [Bacillus phage SDFMU_Pbc]|uniref:Uncharacterized protein n=1 Tax=Bacillus phage SDFMU_Pbc TaxID=3076135 RepID=A0AA96KR41_9CAUD|nr:hypothetical protein [Bacillus phage SDFMU_Pbc]